MFCLQIKRLQAGTDKRKENVPLSLSPGLPESFFMRGHDSFAPFLGPAHFKDSIPHCPYHCHGDKDVAVTIRRADTLGRDEPPL